MGLNYKYFDLDGRYYLNELTKPFSFSLIPFISRFFSICAVVFQVNISCCNKRNDESNNDG